MMVLCERKQNTRLKLIQPTFAISVRLAKLYGDALKCEKNNYHILRKTLTGTFMPKKNYYNTVNFKTTPGDDTMSSDH